MQEGDMDLGGAAGEEETGAPPADPFAETEADGGLGGEEEPTAPEAAEPEPGEGLGGDGGTLEELGGEEGLPPEGQAADPLAGEGEPPAEEPTPEPEDEPEQPKDEPEPEPKPEPKKGKGKAKKGNGKKGTSERTYVVLQKFFPDEGEPYFREAVKDGVRAGNGEQALRKAYAELVSDESGDAINLVVVPEHYFKVKTVQAKVRHERAVEIS